MLRCATAWHAPGARAAVAALANATREQTFAAGQGLPGRVWAFRRPVWVAELSGEALRAGLVTAAAFPIALGDECVGVIELYASDAREPNAEVSAMFATVGGQLASYLARRRKRARARRAFDGAEALVVALDADGRVEIANGTACRALGVGEDELLGRDWFAAAVPSRRATPRARRSRGCWPARASTLADDAGRDTGAGRSSRDADGEPIGALGWGEPFRAAARALVWRHAPRRAAPDRRRRPRGLRVRRADTRPRAGDDQLAQLVDHASTTTARAAHRPAS